ncbi:hypothetical protein EYF80_040681 [Liparis tanakae]|uniref:Uncharacterized protein n=1 Tax=Liparis tanakae TaxID=230148 RepID=A0A4Z2G6I7_9TELE|nr:hypothetical protein EYF80_040681 [Liparis tanakae]
MPLSMALSCSCGVIVSQDGPCLSSMCFLSCIIFLAMELMEEKYSNFFSSILWASSPTMVAAAIFSCFSSCCLLCDKEKGAGGRGQCGRGRVGGATGGHRCATPADTLAAIELRVHPVLLQRVVPHRPPGRRQTGGVLRRSDLVSPGPGAASDPGVEQVEHLHEVEEQGDAGHHQHEDDEDGLLRGPGHVALHREGAGLLGAGEHGHHDEAVQVVLADDEAGLDDDLEHQLGQVAPQQVAFDLHLPLVVRVLGLLQHPGPPGAQQPLPHLVLLVDDVHGVAQVDQRRRGHEDDLEHPEANVRDGEGPIVADVLATGLLRVAEEARLLVAPDALGAGAQNHDPEQEEHAHPDLADDRGVGLDLVQQARQESPVTHLYQRSSVTDL